ncbi:SRPBCC family protein [Gordonia jinhuaensis]|nr:SRPBCC family protein [Gordonia jinhuaensis]
MTGPDPTPETTSTDATPTSKVVSASREIAAPADVIFELIANPVAQVRWDGNDNLAAAPVDERIHNRGDMFAMILTTEGQVRENHVVEFEEGRRIAWMPAEPGRPPFGQLWRWELEPIDPQHTLVTHTYDWTRLETHVPMRVARAEATGVANLAASLDRLAELAEAVESG